MIWGCFMQIRCVIEKLQKEKLLEAGSTQSSTEKIITWQEQNFILRDKDSYRGAVRGNSALRS